MPKTITIGDTEVEIRETDDGFEAVEVEDYALDMYITVGERDNYGFKIPIEHADKLAVKEDPTSSGCYWTAFDTAVDEGDMNTDGNSNGLAAEHGFDGEAWVHDVRLVFE